MVAVLLGGLVIQSAHADSHDRWERKQERREHQLQQNLIEQREDDEGRISPGRAARLAQERNGGGRVLDVVPADDGYRVKLLKDGEVRTVHIPHNP